MGDIYTKDGLLYKAGKIIELPFADKVARDNGFDWAEQFVKHLEKEKDNGKPTQDHR